MANIKSQMKRIKTNEKARMRNRMIRSDLRTNIKKIETLIETEIKQAQEMLPTIYKKIDKAVSKGIIHQNKANRLKSNISKKLNGDTPVKKEVKVEKKEENSEE